MARPNAEKGTAPATSDRGQRQPLRERHAHLARGGGEGEQEGDHHGAEQHAGGEPAGEAGERRHRGGALEQHPPLAALHGDSHAEAEQGGAMTPNAP